MHRAGRRRARRCWARASFLGGVHRPWNCLAHCPFRRPVLCRRIDRGGQAEPGLPVRSSDLEPAPLEWRELCDRLSRDCRRAEPLSAQSSSARSSTSPIASGLSLLIGFPVAYFVTRFSGRRKGFFLALLIAPFWISYMMRMLAWIDLLQNDGYVNRALTFFHLTAHPVDWLGGQSFTVVLGLVYGYIPYLILVLYAGLDRIDTSLIEAGRDLGLNGWRTFLPRDAALVPPVGDDRSVDHRAPDVRRLLHEPDAVWASSHLDDRQRHRWPAQRDEPARQGAALSILLLPCSSCRCSTTSSRRTEPRRSSPDDRRVARSGPAVDVASRSVLAARQARPASVPA